MSDTGADAALVDPLAGSPPLKLSNYSLNYSSLIVRGQMDVFGFLGLCRGMGLEGASLHLRDLPDARPETLARVRRAYLDQGLSVAMVTISTDFGQPVDGLDAELDRARAGIQVRPTWGRRCCGSSPAPAATGPSGGVGQVCRMRPAGLPGCGPGRSADRPAEPQPWRTVRIRCYSPPLRR